MAAMGHDMTKGRLREEVVAEEERQLVMLVQRPLLQLALRDFDHLHS